MKTYRITYRQEIHIKAKTEEEAKEQFEGLNSEEILSKSEFIEIVSLEVEDE